MWSASGRKYYYKHNKNKEWLLAHNVRSKYKLDLAEYREILDSPCEVCGITDKRRVLDHDHATGLVRSALCHECNTKVDWYLKHRTKLEQWRETVFGRFWIKRKEWEQQIVALSIAKVDAQAEARLVELRETTLQDQVTALQLRVKELQGQLAEISAQFAAASSIQPPVIEADWFEEDEEEVRKDRIRIQDEGTSDGLLSES